ncbi:MAG TPA: hypothetical protein VGE52_07385, partial [Pirellulales bacterium]
MALRWLLRPEPLASLAPAPGASSCRESQSEEGSGARANRQFALRSLWLTLIAAAAALGYLRTVGSVAGFDWVQIGAVFGWGSLLSAPGTLAVGLWADGPPSRRPAIAMLVCTAMLGMMCVTAWSLALPNLPVPLLDWRQLWG